MSGSSFWVSILFSLAVSFRASVSFVFAVVRVWWTVWRVMLSWRAMAASGNPLDLRSHIWVCFVVRYPKLRLMLAFPHM